MVHVLCIEIDFDAPIMSHPRLVISWSRFQCTTAPFVIHIVTLHSFAESMHTFLLVTKMSSSNIVEAVDSIVLLQLQECCSCKA